MSFTQLWNKRVTLYGTVNEPLLQQIILWYTKDDIIIMVDVSTVHLIKIESEHHAFSWVRYSRSVYHTFDKDGIIYNKTTSFQLRVRNKPWTAAGDIHIWFWFPERAAHWVWLECIDNIPSSCLVDELESDIVCEWPLEYVVKLSTHHHKEQWEVSALPNAIPHDVETKTHLVAVATRVEGKGEDGCVFPILSISFSLTELWNFPYHGAIMVAVFNERQSKVTVFKFSILWSNLFL